MKKKRATTTAVLLTALTLFSVVAVKESLAGQMTFVWEDPGTTFGGNLDDCIHWYKVYVAGKNYYAVHAIARGAENRDACTTMTKQPGCETRGFAVYGLPTGNYSAVVKSLNTCNGMESDSSNAVNKSVNNTTDDTSLSAYYDGKTAYLSWTNPKDTTLKTAVVVSFRKDTAQKVVFASPTLPASPSNPMKYFIPLQEGMEAFRVIFIDANNNTIAVAETSGQ